MKSITIFVLVFTIFNLIDAQSHNMVWGRRSIKDFHLKRQVITVKSRFLRIVEADLTFEQKNVLYPRKITQVVAIDQYTNNKGGYATITGGGPGFAFVKLNFKSKRGHGIKFIVDIYGQ